MRPFLIGIAGPSCSGKTEVSRRLARILRAPVLALDHYYKDLKHVPADQRASRNFDAPDALDSDLICKHVLNLKQGHNVEQPVYDFSQHVRSDSTHCIEGADFVLVEGLFVLYWREVRDHLDFRIYISTDHETCLARRIYRDVRERGRTEEAVRTQYKTTVLPMAELYLTPSKVHADMVLNGISPVKESVYSILVHVATRLEDTRREDTVRQAMEVCQVASEEDQP